MKCLAPAILCLMTNACQFQDEAAWDATDPVAGDDCCACVYQAGRNNVGKACGAVRIDAGEPCDQDCFVEAGVCKSWFEKECQLYAQARGCPRLTYLRDSNNNGRVDDGLDWPSCRVADVYVTAHASSYHADNFCEIIGTTVAGNTASSLRLHHGGCLVASTEFSRSTIDDCLTTANLGPVRRLEAIAHAVCLSFGRVPPRSAGFQWTASPGVNGQNTLVREPIFQ
jgi:hypothetical protein